MRVSSRRFFLLSAAASLLPAEAAPAPVKRSETVYRFMTPECDGRMSIQFFDKYSSQGFWFDDRLTSRKFCLSGQGNEGKNCLSQFSGSIAIALYHFRARPHSPRFVNVRERVRTIDQDPRMTVRPPFEKTLDVQREIVSDIQAFGYNKNDPAESSPVPEFDPWCLLRQDLYFDDQSAPFLIVHWKHTLNAISLIDMIPGDRTQIVGG